MSARPIPRAARRVRLEGELSGDILRRASAEGEVSRGYHNTNYVWPLPASLARQFGRRPGTKVTVRTPHRDVLGVVIRTWPDEGEIIDALRSGLPYAPECLAKGEDYAIHSYVEGVALASVCANGKPVDALLIRALTELLAQFSCVRKEALPPLPSYWPRSDQDSQAFLRTLARLADRQIRRPNRSAFGGLFAALGVPEDAFERLADRVPTMKHRPYSLLHADLHRDNVIISYGAAPPLVCVDWELATFGDPLHDLATHVVRMRYPADQWDEVIDCWERAMRRVRPDAVDGLSRDLRHYVEFERAQSVFPDVIRAARSLEESFDQKSLDEAVLKVVHALNAAADPLQLRNVPSARDTERILFRWWASRPSAERSPRVFESWTMGWLPDPRLPEHPGFPRSAVRSALAAEGAAPAGRVLKGTMHLNCVVRPTGIDFPVVVRRPLPNPRRRERCYLSEHAVLRAIEQSGARVMAPRVLAVGRTYGYEPFAIHTYVGEPDLDRRPRHPVHGLLPCEADALVDQLYELTTVDHRSLSPAAAGGFLDWLREQLVSLVENLPRESQQLLRLLGLPDAPRLREILSRYRMSERTPALLHGDLHPRNLVRREGFGGVAIVGWERALIGDPLYDMVRHIHLTPIRREIRDRMFRRWERMLPEAFTHDWDKDWRVYRQLEIVRSAYIGADRLMTGADRHASDIRGVSDSYRVMLQAAAGVLGLPVRPTSNPYLVRALA